MDQMIENELQQLSKEALIERIKTLQAHNAQLKNVIAKNVSPKTNTSRKQKSFNFDNCNYRHVLLKLFYLGWDYHGYAVQEDNPNTIEAHLFKAFTKTCLIKDRASSNYHRCGRTDKGVSSFGQVISITLRSRLSQEQQHELQNEIDYCKVLNRVLPDDIQCVAWRPVAYDYSARFNCKKRTYKYFFPKATLDIELMRVAAQYLVGTHDFRNFCKMDVGNGVVKFVRNILSVRIDSIENTLNGDYSIYVLTIEGNAFLWHQIRCIVGVLFLVGRKKEPPEVVKELLDVDLNPRKPEYGMANEVPLNLFDCDYESSDDWYYDEATIKAVIDKLHTIWTFSAVRTGMIQTMLDRLETLVKEPNHAVLTECLVQGVKSKRYIPLLKRQKCDSLEDRIEHYNKKSRPEAVPINKEHV